MTVIETASPIAQLILSIGAILVQWAASNPETRTRGLQLFRIFLIVVAFVLCFASVRGIANQKAKSDELQTTLDKIGANHGDPDLLRKYLAAIHQLNVDASQQTADNFARNLDNVIAAQPGVRARRQGRIEEADRLTTQHWPNVGPVVDSLLTQFDALVGAAQQQREVEVTNVRRMDIDSQTVAKTLRSNSQLRATSIGKVTLLLDMYPARIDDAGQITDSFARIMCGSEMALELRIAPPTASLVNKGTSFAFPDLEANLDVPEQSAALRKAIGHALTEIFTVAVRRALDDS